MKKRNLSLLIAVFCFGCIQFACAQGLFPQVESESVNAVAGNWQVELTNNDGETIYSTRITLTPPVGLSQVRTDEGFFKEVHSLSADESWEAYYHETNVYDRGLEVSGRTMRFLHAYGVGGHWGSESIINFENDTGAGEWSYRDDYSGPERWKRLRPKVTRVEFGPLRAHEFGSVHSAPASAVNYGQPARVTAVYDESVWGEGNNFPHARPKFYIRLFGENLQGFHLADVAGAAGFRVSTGWSYEESEQSEYRVSKSGAIFELGGSGGNRMGQTYVLALWPGVTNGLKTFRLDDLEIPFVLDVEGLSELGPKLRFIDTKGSEIEGVIEGQVFALQAEFDEAESLPPTYTALVTQGSKQLDVPVRLIDPSARVYRSGYYRIMQPRLVGQEESWSDWRASGDEIDIPEETAVILARHFGGVWQVHKSDAANQASLMGKAWVTSAGGRAELRLGRGDALRQFEMYDAEVGLTPDGKAPAYWVAYFAEYETFPEHGLHPAVTDLWFPRKAGEIVFELEKSEEVLPVDYLNEARQPALLEVTFPQPLKEWLAGDWSVDQELAPVGKGGATVWTRKPPVIDEVVVLRDQSPGVFSSEYPEDFSEQGNIQTIRRLLVVGENLPVDSEMFDHVGTSPESDDPLIEYTKVVTDGAKPERDLKKAYDDRKRARPPAGKDYIVVNANLDFGVAAGQKTLSLAGARGEWVLHFSDALAKLRFTRTFASGSKSSLESVRIDDAAYLAIEFEHDRHLADKESIELAIFSGKEKPVILGRVVAKRAKDEIKPEFRTEALYFNREGTEPDPDVAMNIEVKEGMVLTVIPVDRGIVVAPASVTIDESDYMVGEYWLDALKAVKVAGGKGDIDKPKEFAMETAEGYNKSLYVAGVLDDRNRKIDLRNGDHAAAVLIRDEFVRRMAELLPLYEKQADSPVQIQGFIREAQDNIAAARKDPFWKYNSKRSGSFPGGLPLWELLDTDDLMQRFGWADRKATELWVFESVQAALKERVRNMSDAKDRAAKASAYKIEELMVFAGYRSPEVIDAITARLLVKEDGRWVPDDQAIRFVEGLYVAGAAMRALEAYSDIDNTYNMLALAVVTGGAAGALELGGLSTAAAYTSFIANTADAIVSGGFGLHEYLKGESDFDLARGMAPIYGEEIVRDAAAGRQSGLMTALGILFPGQAATRELMGIPGLHSIARGKEIAGKVTKGTGKLSDLDDVSKVELLDYYKSLRDRRIQAAAGGKVHPPLTPEDLKNYRELRKVLHPKPTKSPAEMTAAEQQSLESLRADEALDGMIEEGRAVVRRRGPDESGYYDPYGTGEFEALPKTERMNPKESGYYDPYGTGEFETLPKTERMNPKESGYYDPYGTGEFEALPKTERMNPKDSGYFDPHGTGEFEALPKTERMESIPKTEAFTAEERAALEAGQPAKVDEVFDPNKTQPIPVDPNKTQPLPFDPNKTQPVPLDAVEPLPPSGNQANEFGMSPGDPNAPIVNAEPSPLVRLERERIAAEEAISKPFKGRDAMDAKNQAEADFFRQRQAENAQEDINSYDLENWKIRGTPEYDEGLAKLQNDWEARTESADAFREKRRAALEKDHAVLDVVEKHTGYRSAGDYSALDLERLRPGREFADEQAIAGVMANRFKSKSGPLQGTPEQHMNTLKDAGLSREQAKAYLMEWYNPAANPNDVEGVSKFVDGYLDWVGLK